MVGTKYIPILPLTTGLTGRAARKSERIVPRNAIELLFPSMVARSEERKLGCGVVGMAAEQLLELIDHQEHASALPPGCAAETLRQVHQCIGSTGV